MAATEAMESTESNQSSESTAVDSRRQKSIEVEPLTIGNHAPKTKESPNMQTETTVRNRNRNRNRNHNRNHNPSPRIPEKIMKTTLFAFVAFLLFAGTTTSAQSWIGGTGTWDDTTTANWNTGAVPVNGGTVQITTPGITVAYTATNLVGTGLAQFHLMSTGAGTTVFTLDGSDNLPVSSVLSVGRYANGAATFNLTGSATVTINGGGSGLVLGGSGGAGPFVFNQTGGTFTNGIGSGSLVYIYPNATYNLSGGSYIANRNLDLHGGTFNQTGGVVTLADGYGMNIAASSTFQLATGGTFNQGGASIVIGQDASANWTGGTLTGQLGRLKLTGSGAIWTMQGGAVTVNRSGNTSAALDSLYLVPSSTIQGYGTIQDARFGASSPATFDNSGRVVANGYGANQDLNLTRFGQSPATSMIVNTTDNPTTNGTNGWFATDQGKLLLPNVAVTGATASYNWGEAAADTTIDLVNSARFTFSGHGNGTLSGALLAVDRSDVPAFAVAGLSRADLFSVHDFTSTAGGTATLTIRYDDVAAAGFEDVLQIFHYTGGAWMPLTSTVDLTNKWVTANGITSFSLFAVGYAIPEPTSALLLGLATLVLLKRTRKP